jgi:broad specificity phosphatase PhoE
VKSLLLIRHLKPVGAGVFLGRTDPHLEIEYSQVRGFNADRVFCSPLARAKETVLRLFGDIDYHVEPGLSEIDYGLWEGKSWAEIEAQWPEIAALKMSDWLNVTPPDAEPWDLFSSRVISAFQRIEKKDESVAIVAHLGVNSVINHYLTGEDPITFKQEYGEVIEF